MKTSYLFVVGALTGSLFLTARASASPGGFSGRVTPYEAYATDGLSRIHLDPVAQGGPRKWSFGAYAELQRRHVETRRGITSMDWDADMLMGSLGYDVLSNLTLLGAVGRNSLALNDQGYGSDAVWLLGARMRLLDFFVFDPMSLGDLYWCRLDSVVHYSESDGAYAGSDFEWSEWRAALTVSFMTRPMQLGYLDSLGFYIGPAYSKLKADTWQGRLDGKDDVGLVAGVFANPSRHTLLKLELSRFERNSMNISAGFHF